MRSLIIAFAMYSRFPMPEVEWDAKNLSWALCWFPLVGAAIGCVLFGWLLLAEWLGLSALRGAGAVLLPILLSGGIHMDGFCDTCDARSSHQSRERKLEILKDSHTGAFAVICCGLLLLVWFAAWQETAATVETAALLSLTPVLSRALAGWTAVKLPNARGTGLLASFTSTMDLKKARLILGGWSIGTAGVILALGVFWGGSALMAAGGSLLGACLALGYYGSMSKKEFGGVTGDLSGFFLCICECAAVVCGALAQAVGGMLL